MISINSTYLDKRNVYKNPSFQGHEYRVFGKILYEDGNRFSGLVQHNLKSGKYLRLQYKNGLLTESTLYKTESIPELAGKISGIKYIQILKESIKKYFYEKDTEKLIGVREHGIDTFQIKRQLLGEPGSYIDIIGNKQMRIYKDFELVNCLFPSKKMFSSIEHEGDVINETRYKLTSNPEMSQFGNVTYNNNTYFIEPYRYLSHNNYTQEGIYSYYNPQGQMVKKISKNTQYDTYTEYHYSYNNKNQVISNRAFNSEGILLYEELYKYDKNGNICSLITKQDGKNFLIWNFNAQGKKTASIKVANGKVTEKELYEYDSKNRIIKNVKYNYSYSKSQPNITFYKYGTDGLKRKININCAGQKTAIYYLKNSERLIFFDTKTDKISSYIQKYYNGKELIRLEDRDFQNKITSAREFFYDEQGIHIKTVHKDEHENIIAQEIYTHNRGKTVTTFLDGKNNPISGEKFEDLILEVED